MPPAPLSSRTFGRGAIDPQVFRIDTCFEVRPFSCEILLQMHYGQLDEEKLINAAEDDQLI